MKTVELRLPQDHDKSFIVFEEIGQYFPCPWHYHSQNEIVLVVSSTGRRMVGDNIGHFSKGDLVFMGSSLPHVWVNDPVYINGKANHLAEAIVIHFDDDFLGKRFIEVPEMEAFHHFRMLSKRGMSFHGSTRDEVNTLIKEMVGMNGIQRLSSLLLIFDIVSNSKEYTLLASPGYHSDIVRKEADRLGKIMKYIVENFDKDISLPEVANMSNMATTTFCNSFKKQYRTTFVDYLNSVRIGNACKLLSEKNEHIVEIAYKCGFNNLANFNRQFKKYKKMTPTQFRKSLTIPECVQTNRVHARYR